MRKEKIGYTEEGEELNISIKYLDSLLEAYKKVILDKSDIFRSSYLDPRDTEGFLSYRKDLAALIEFMEGAKRYDAEILKALLARAEALPPKLSFYNYGELNRIFADARKELRSKDPFEKNIGKPTPGKVLTRNME